jgi:predicted nucleotidyltransferase
MIGILIAHTSNWIFNGHGGMIFLRILKETLKSIRLSYIKDLRKRLESRNIIAVIYGSMCRNEDNIHSDIDVYVINTGGTLNGLKCSFFNSVERMRAVVRGIPLDIYCIDSIEHLKRRISIWQKEKYFLILSDPLGVIRNCPDIPTKRLEDLA